MTKPIVTEANVVQTIEALRAYKTQYKMEFLPGASVWEVSGLRYNASSHAVESTTLGCRGATLTEALQVAVDSLYTSFDQPIKNAKTALERHQKKFGEVQGKFRPPIDMDPNVEDDDDDVVEKDFERAEADLSRVK